MIIANGVYYSKMSRASLHGQPRFGGALGHLVEKSGGIDKIEVDNFPEYKGKLPSASVNIDLGTVQSVADYKVNNGSSLAGGLAGGVAVAAGVDYFGEKTGLKSAMNGGFLRLVGGGNLGLDDPICFNGCEKTQTLIINVAIAGDSKGVEIFTVETNLTGTKKHMPNEILAENLKHVLSLF